VEWFDDLNRSWESEYGDLDLSNFPPLVRLARLGVLIDAFQHDVLEPFELTPSDYGVLAALRRAGQPYALKPTQLYSRLRRSSGGMTKILKRLEESELIERKPDPDDGRGSRVTLTPRGLSLQERVFHAFITATTSLMAPLNEHQKRAADRSLGELLEVFEGRAQQRTESTPALLPDRRATQSSGRAGLQTAGHRNRHLSKKEIR
jgi:DNA-binding MarR family transcriptional regulator